MTDAEKRQKEREKKIKKFHKQLGVLGASESDIKKAVLEFAKTTRYWGEIFLTPEQESDAGFMLQIFGTNDDLINQYYIPRVLKDDAKFVLEYLNLAYRKGNVHGDDAYEYYRELRNFPVRQNPEFLIEFSRKFPECNLVGIISNVVSEYWDFTERKKAFKDLISKMPHDIYTSQARRHGYKFVSNISSENPYYMESLIMGIEKDGFKSLACLPKGMIWEKRDLIVLASKHDNFEGLKRYFLDTLSPRQEHDYMCHGEPHSYSFNEFEFYPLRKALIEDDVLFDAIEAPKADKDKLRAYIAKETKEFYEQIKPYEERGLVAQKGEKGQTVVGKIAQNVQRSNKDGK